MTGLPASQASPTPVRSPLEPAWIRHGSEATRKAYQAALQFEQVLVEQLAKTMTANGTLATGGGEGEEESAGSSSLYTSMLPQAMASGVVAGGGLGLAAQLTRELAPHEAAASSGGASAATGALRA